MKLEVEEYTHSYILLRKNTADDLREIEENLWILYNGGSKHLFRSVKYKKK